MLRRQSGPLTVIRRPKVTPALAPWRRKLLNSKEYLAQSDWTAIEVTQCRQFCCYHSQLAPEVGGVKVGHRFTPSGVDCLLRAVHASALSALFRYVNLTLLAWVRRKFKRCYKGHKVRAAGFVEKLARTRPDLFVHWRLGMTGEFA